MMAKHLRNENNNVFNKQNEAS